MPRELIGFWTKPQPVQRGSNTRFTRAINNPACYILGACHGFPSRLRASSGHRKKRPLKRAIPIWSGLNARPRISHRCNPLKATSTKPIEPRLRGAIRSPGSMSCLPPQLEQIWTRTMIPSVRFMTLARKFSPEGSGAGAPRDILRSPQPVGGPALDDAFN